MFIPYHLCPSSGTAIEQQGPNEGRDGAHSRPGDPGGAELRAGPLHALRVQTQRAGGGRGGTASPCLLHGSVFGRSHQVRVFVDPSLPSKWLYCATDKQYLYDSGVNYLVDSKIPDHQAVCTLNYRLVHERNINAVAGKATHS